MTYLPFCASLSCHLHELQVRRDLDSFRAAFYEAPERTIGMLGDGAAFEIREFRRVWFQAGDGSRFSLCEDCARAGTVLPGRDFYAAVRRTCGGWEAKRGARPKSLAVGREQYVTVRRHLEGQFLQFGPLGNPEMYQGLEVIRLNQPSGAFVF